MKRFVFVIDAETQAMLASLAEYHGVSAAAVVIMALREKYRRDIMPTAQPAPQPTSGMPDV